MFLLSEAVNDSIVAFDLITGLATHTWSRYALALLLSMNDSDRAETLPGPKVQVNLVSGSIDSFMCLRGGRMVHLIRYKPILKGREVDCACQILC